MRESNSNFNNEENTGLDITTSFGDKVKFDEKGVKVFQASKIGSTPNGYDAKKAIEASLDVFSKHRAELISDLTKCVKSQARDYHEAIKILEEIADRHKNYRSKRQLIESVIRTLEYEINQIQQDIFHIPLEELNKFRLPPF